MASDLDRWCTSAKGARSAGSGAATGDVSGLTLQVVARSSRVRMGRNEFAGAAQAPVTLSIDVAK
jgi:hypothetical protein